MTRSDMADVLTLIAERAPALRSSGVRSFVIGDVRVDLEPAATPDYASAASDEDEDEEPSDPLDDPTTFGRPAGSRVPGYQRDDEED